jgi:acetyltransferase
MSVANLEQLFRPTSVAVLGASDEAGSPGAVVMRNLTRGKFLGPVMPVNDSVEQVAGVETSRDVDTLPLTPDLAIICSRPRPSPATSRPWAGGAPAPRWCSPAAFSASTASGARPSARR